MPPKHKNNPIANQFRAAGRLINEWRDTISYSGYAVASTVFMAIQSRPHHHISALEMAIDTAICLAPMAREASRALGWEFSKEPVTAGYHAKPIDGKDLTVSAGFASAFSFLPMPLIVSAATGFSPTNVKLGIFAGIVSYTALKLNGGSFGKVYKDYDKVMWDYPRKKGDGGTTQTQKLKDGIQGFLHTAGETISELVPTPSRVPVPVRMPSGGNRAHHPKQ